MDDGGSARVHLGAWVRSADLANISLRETTSTIGLISVHLTCVKVLQQYSQVLLLLRHLLLVHSELKPSRSQLCTLSYSRQALRRTSSSEKTSSSSSGSASASPSPSGPPSPAAPVSSPSLSRPLPLPAPPGATLVLRLLLLLRLRPLPGDSTPLHGGEDASGV